MIFNLSNLKFSVAFLKGLYELDFYQVTYFIVSSLNCFKRNKLQFFSINQYLKLLNKQINLRCLFTIDISKSLIYLFLTLTDICIEFIKQSICNMLEVIKVHLSFYDILHKEVLACLQYFVKAIKLVEIVFDFFSIMITFNVSKKFILSYKSLHRCKLILVGFKYWRVGLNGKYLFEQGFTIYLRPFHNTLRIV